MILWGKPALQLILVRYPNLNKIDLLYSFLVIRSLNRAHIKNEKSAGFWKLNAFVIFLNKDFWPFRRQRAETSFGKSVTHGGILNLKNVEKQSIFTQNATLVCCGCPTKCRPCQIFFDSWKLCWSYWTDFVPNWWNEEQKNELFQWLIYVSLYLQWKLWLAVSLHQRWGFQTVRMAF